MPEAWNSIWIPLFPHLLQFMPVHEHFTYVSTLLTISTALASVQASLCFTKTIILCKSSTGFTVVGLIFKAALHTLSPSMAPYCPLSEEQISHTQVSL